MLACDGLDAAIFCSTPIQDLLGLSYEDQMKVLFSKDDFTQGDPLSMLIYAVALVKSLKAKENRLQTGNANDSACIGSIKEVRSWYDQVAEQGPAYGYFA